MPTIRRFTIPAILTAIVSVPATLLTFTSASPSTPAIGLPAAASFKPAPATRTLVPPRQAQAPAQPETIFYLTKPGDSLWSVASRTLGSGFDWPALWWANRKALPTLADLVPGLTLEIPASGAVTSQMRLAAYDAAGYSQVAASSPAGAAPPASIGLAAFRSCVISRESGGNPDAWNGPHWGLFQMTSVLWAAGGGLPASWGSASTDSSTQVSVFDRIVAGNIDGGAQNWSPYDGCAYSPVVTTSAPSGAYADPLRAISGLVADRVDMGVDYSGSGPVYALGPGIIQAIYCNCTYGWPGGGWICELLTGGPDAGSSVYVAEDATAQAYTGEKVWDTTVIATMWGGIETGWAQTGCAGNALAGSYPGYPTAAGISYNSVLVSVGAPSGTGISGASQLVRTRHSASTRSTKHRCTWRCLARNEAMDWALTQAGHAYCWGGTGPCYDCSGLVTMAYRHAGIDLPRTTYDILADVGVRHYRKHSWWVLVQVTHPQRGDLAFYGPGHVELKSKRQDTTFGAHDYGSPVSDAQWGYGWKPTAFYRIEVHYERS